MLEKIAPGFGSSFFIRMFENLGCDKPQWHFHPEYEIVYIREGEGKRHIGDHIGSYEDGELIFLGPNIPHLSFVEPERKIVLQMREDFLGKTFIEKPEMQDIRRLFERSKNGLIFLGEFKHHIGQQLVELVDQPPFNRLVGLLQVLQEMALNQNYQSLNAIGSVLEVNTQDHDRIQSIYSFVEEHFQRPISLEEAAAVISMTVPAFCRYFKKQTNRTFTQFVNEIRIAYACRLLGDESQTISAVSLESGFNNLSHFNKQFRQIAGLSPREYRQNLRKVVS